MLYRVEILKGHVRHIVRTHYRTGIGVAEMKLFAERARQLQGGDGFRLCDLHSNEVIEFGALKISDLEQELERKIVDHAALIAQLKALNAAIPASVCG